MNGTQREGILFLKTRKKKHVGLKRWNKCYGLFNTKSKSLELFKKKDGRSRSVILVGADCNVAYLGLKNNLFAFSLQTEQYGTFLFGVHSIEDMSGWMRIIQDVVTKCRECHQRKNTQIVADLEISIEDEMPDMNCIICSENPSLDDLRRQGCLPSGFGGIWQTLSDVDNMSNMIDVYRECRIQVGRDPAWTWATGILNGSVEQHLDMCLRENNWGDLTWNKPSWQLHNHSEILMRMSAVQTGSCWHFSERIFPLKRMWHRLADGSIIILLSSLLSTTQGIMLEDLKSGSSTIYKKLLGTVINGKLDVGVLFEPIINENEDIDGNDESGAIELSQFRVCVRCDPGGATPYTMFWKSDLTRCYQVELIRCLVDLVCSVSESLISLPTSADEYHPSSRFSSANSDGEYSSDDEEGYNSNNRYDNKNNYQNNGKHDFVDENGDYFEDIGTPVAEYHQNEDLENINLNLDQ
eukprot:TRINITY_DN5018_c0_g1_i1.p1 TRINITY_DN5018_c0_g1~~TRINITY_DN5018_c0_g1_i1.p1  ORF type:complete len:487 (-),score=95.41 TRINITY_DN5018_c0_g1_i1:63-1463(-)